MGLLKRRRAPPSKGIPSLSSFSYVESLCAVAGWMSSFSPFSKNSTVQFPDRRVVPHCYKERSLLSAEAAPKDPGAALNQRLAGATPAISSAVLFGPGMLGAGLCAGDNIRD
jgi:hypothetical protein